MIVTLTPEMIAEADYVALQRRMIGKTRATINRVNYTDSESELINLDKLGTRGERAGKIYFDPIKWNMYETALPDLGDFIDVKTTAYDPPWLKAPKGTVKPHWAYVLACAAKHPDYRLVGWLWGRELLTAPIREPQPNQPCHVVKEGSPLLLPMPTLWHIHADKWQ